MIFIILRSSATALFARLEIFPFFFFFFFLPISKDINIVFYGALLVLLSFASVPRASPSVLAPEVNSDRSPRFVQFMVHSFD